MAETIIENMTGLKSKSCDKLLRLLFTLLNWQKRSNKMIGCDIKGVNWDQDRKQRKSKEYQTICLVNPTQTEKKMLVIITRAICFICTVSKNLQLTKKLYKSIMSVYYCSLLTCWLSKVQVLSGKDASRTLITSLKSVVLLGLIKVKSLYSDIGDIQDLKDWLWDNMSPPRTSTYFIGPSVLSWICRFLLGFL